MSTVADRKAELIAGLYRNGLTVDQIRRHVHGRRRTVELVLVKAGLISEVSKKDPDADLTPNEVAIIRALMAVCIPFNRIAEAVGMEPKALRPKVNDMLLGLYGSEPIMPYPKLNTICHKVPTAKMREAYLFFRRGRVGRMPKDTPTGMSNRIKISKDEAVRLLRWFEDCERATKKKYGFKASEVYPWETGLGLEQWAST